MRDLGEHRQADAMEADATSMTRRARLHLRAMVARSEAEQAGQEAP